MKKLASCDNGDLVTNNDLNINIHNYLLYIRRYNVLKNDYILQVYQTKTFDIFHTIGEIIYTSFEKIDRITFADWTVERINFFKTQNIDILTYTNKF